MYWGSVRFFKHLILGTLLLAILIPTGLSIYYGVSYHRALAQIEALTSTDGNSANPNKSSKAESSEASQEAAPYQSLYPDLYVTNDFTYTDSEQKTVYLTFEDGPSSLTAKILDILGKYQVTATFFVRYKDDAASKALYQRMIEEGHSIGVLGASSDYKQIYASVDSYLADFAKTARLLKSVTGAAPDIFRFPGGSINVYNRAIYRQLIAEMTRRGYTYLTGMSAQEMLRRKGLLR